MSWTKDLLALLKDLLGLLWWLCSDAFDPCCATGVGVAASDGRLRDHSGRYRGAWGAGGDPAAGAALLPVRQTPCEYPACRLENGLSVAWRP